MFPFFNTDNLSGDQRAELEKQKMHMEALMQQVNNWFDHASIDDLQVMRYILLSIMHDEDDVTAPMYVGTIASQLRYKHHVEPNTGESTEFKFPNDEQVGPGEAEPETKAGWSVADWDKQAVRHRVITKYDNNLDGPVICIHCDSEFPSLTDRMLREDCPTCAHKSKWGG